VTELRPSGAAEFDGERVDVTTDGEWLPAGTPVTVVKAEAMRVVVKRAHQLPASAGQEPH
jgi:membrane-bound serine protease (ClpP class)